MKFQSSNPQIPSDRREVVKKLLANIKHQFVFAVFPFCCDFQPFRLFGFALARALYLLIPWVVFAVGELEFG